MVQVQHRETPIQSREIGKSSVRVYGKPYDFTLPIFRQDDLRNDFKRQQFQELRAIIEPLGFSRVYVPKTNECPATITQPSDWEQAIQDGSFTMYRGHYADGLIVPNNGPVLHRTADCPTINVTNRHTGDTIAAHAGRDSVIDRRALRGDTPRQHPSIVDSIMQHFEEVNPCSISVLVTCGIKGEDFGHPLDRGRHCTFNEKLIRHVEENWGHDCIIGDRTNGAIDLFTVIQRQFRTYGVTGVLVSPLDTFKNPNLHSHRAGDTGRNGVLVW